MDDKTFLLKTIELAKESVRQGGFSAGAVVVKDGKAISEGISIGEKLHDPTSHAETAAIREACKILGTSHLDGAALYASLASCAMCFSVANWAGISRIVYGCEKTPEMIEKKYYEGQMDTKELNKQNNRQIELVYIPDFEKDIQAVIREWEKAFE